MVGAAILPRDKRVLGVRDSKMLTEDERERLFDRIAGWCLAWSVGAVEPGGVRRARHDRGADAWRAGVRSTGSASSPTSPSTDGKWNFVSPCVRRVEMRVKADRDCLSVAAASILAKVVRDREMRVHADSFPHWSFDSNKGYPCPAHKAALQGYGPSAIHRRTWIFMDHYVPWSGTHASIGRAADAVLTPW